MTTLREGLYAMYLRKSRQDIESENVGEYETLARHEQILTDLAERYGIKIASTYREVVSGDTIKDRPQVQALLEAVRLGTYAGVLCTEVSRLARGNTKDQGEVAEAFTASNTLIVTPSKIYDPQDEADSTFFDFELFMARQEFKYIKKRLKAGKLASMRAGNWLQAFAPTGYDKVGKTLQPNHLAPAVTHILQSYADGSMGMADCVRYMRSQGMEHCSTTTVRYILTNLAYAGLLQIGINPVRTATGKDGKLHTYRVHEKTGEVVQGNWPALVSRETMERCRSNLAAAPKVKVGSKMLNIFAGLLRCERCNRVFIRESPARGRKRATIRHAHGVDFDNKCNCSRAGYDEIVADVQQALRDSLPSLSASSSPKRKPVSIAPLEAKLRKARDARAGLYDKLDMGLYTAEEYRQRSARWDAEISSIEKSIKEAADVNAYHMTAKERKATTKDLIKLLDTPSENVELINRILKQLIERITYWRDDMESDYRLTIYWRE